MGPIELEPPILVSGQSAEKVENEMEGTKLDDVEMDALDCDVSILVPCMSEAPTPSPGPQPSGSFYDPDLLPASTFILSALSVTPIPRSGKNSPRVSVLNDELPVSDKLLFEPHLGQTTLSFNYFSKFPKPIWPKTTPTIPTSYFKDYQRSKRKVNDLIFDDIVRPAPVVRRPFESLGNPYPQSCSKLCNHPINSVLKKEYKDVIKKAKDSYGSDGRTLLLPEEELVLRNEMNRLRATSSLEDQDLEDDEVNSCESSSLPRPDLDDDEDRIPEELLLKYTKPDSPTSHYRNSPISMTSGGSRRKVSSEKQPISVSQKSSRRCQTPDQLPPSDQTGKRTIVLDLRRTKSSENLHVAEVLDVTESEELPSASKIEEVSIDQKREISPTSSREEPQKETQQVEAPQVSLQISESEQQSETAKPKKESRKEQSVTIAGKTTPPHPGSPTSGKAKKSRKDSSGGKKSKKKFARHKVRSDSPDKDEFQYDLEDPGDTQVSSSGVGEPRPRAFVEAPHLEAIKESDGIGHAPTVVAIGNQAMHDTIDDENFDLAFEQTSKQIFQDDPLERRALLLLEKQLEHEEPSSRFDIKRLHEVDERLIKTVRQSMGRNTSGVESEIKELEKELALPGVKPANDSVDDLDEAEIWLQLPRTFSYQSSRFELPLDMTQMADMTPLDYLSRYTCISSARRQLYNKVFVRHRSLKDGMVNDEATIKALEEVIGSPFSHEHRSQLWQSLNITLRSHIYTAFTFRQFSGIAAMVERLFRSQFATSADVDQKRPPVEHKSEIEVADFDRLLSKLEIVSVAPALKSLLIKIKDSGFPKANAQYVSGGQILTRRRSRFDFL